MLIVNSWDNIEKYKDYSEITTASIVVYFVFFYYFYKHMTKLHHIVLSFDT